MLFQTSALLTLIGGPGNDRTIGAWVFRTFTRNWDRLYTTGFGGSVHLFPAIFGN